MAKMTFITLTQGNPIALKRTMDSLKDICDEFVVGSVCIFDEDLEMIKSYNNEFNLKVVELPFNYIYLHGFSMSLNYVASFSDGNICVYLNVGEIVESSERDILSVISDEYNCYYIDHATEKHRWFRVWNKREMHWSGLIHEEIIGEHRPYHRPLFRFADTEKDTGDKFKSAVCNDAKEIVYWRQLMSIVDFPETLGATHVSWIPFAKDNYQGMQERLDKKGKRPYAFFLGDKEMYLNDVYTNPEFEKERFESNHIIEFQGDPKYLGK